MDKLVMQGEMYCKGCPDVSNWTSEHFRAFKTEPQEIKHIDLFSEGHGDFFITSVVSLVLRLCVFYFNPLNVIGLSTKMFVIFHVNSIPLFRHMTKSQNKNH